MSPWDLEPIDEDRRPDTVGRVPVLPSEIVGTLYRPRPEDWGGDRDPECKRISAALSQVMKLKIAEPFASTVDPNLHPYPMDLSTVKARLDNSFYRRVDAVLFDFSHVFAKAESNNIRSASIVKNMCLEIIGTRDTVQVIYQRLTTNQSHHSPSGSRNPQSHQSSRPVPSPHNPASVSSGHPSSVRSTPSSSHSSSQGKVNRSLTQKGKNGKKNFECKTCTKTFSSESMLDSHLLIHTEEQPFPCHVCGKSFTHHCSLESHLRVHASERRYKCRICPKSFTRPASLKKHTKKHRCDICLEKFSRTSDLKLHKRKHSGERIYECRGCQKKYIGSSGLRNHWKTSNCEPHSVEGRSFSDSSDSDVEGNNSIFQTYSTKLTNVCAQQVRRTRMRKRATR